MQKLLDVLTLLEFYVCCVVINRLKSNLERNSKLKESIKELFRQ
jgi:hypothetical protein